MATQLPNVAVETLLTGDELLAMGDIGPCELVEGSDVTQKLREYFGIGVQLVWIADPVSRTVYAYRSLTDVREFGEADSLTGDDVLPGFSVPVAQLFED
jgi:Uma2 family endonuclease